MCKSPMSEPATVTRVNGHKLRVQFADGKTGEVHLERVLQIPRGYYDPEHSVQPPPGPGAEVMPDVPATGNPGAPAQEPGTVRRRSPGMMLEDGGKAVEEHSRLQRRGSSGRGKLDGLIPGNSMVAYSVSSAEKLLNIGRYVGADDGGLEVDVHAYGVGTDHRMTAKWKPLFLTSEGQPRFAGEEDATDKPMIERIRTRDIIRAVGLTSKGIPVP